MQNKESMVFNFCNICRDFRFRLIFLVVIMGITLVTIGLVVQRYQRITVSNYQTIALKNLPATTLSSNLSTIGKDLRAYIFRLGDDSLTEEEITTIKQRIEDTNNQAEYTHREYAALSMQDKEKELYESMIQAWKTFYEVGLKTLNAKVEKKNIADYRELVRGDFRNSSNAYNESVLAIVEYLKENSRLTGDIAKSGADVAQKVGEFAIYIGIIIAIGGLLAVLTILKELSIILRNVLKIAECIQQGDFDQHLSDFSANPEIGKMIIALNSMSNSLKNRALFVQNVASGNLISNAEISSSKDNLGKSLQEMIISLRKLVLNIKSASSDVSSSVGDINSISNNLVEGAKNQCTMLANSLEELAEVKHKTLMNTERANSAQKLAQDIQVAVELGQDKINSTGKSMDEIYTLGQKVTQIVKVIDDIAFQTNLLALNAAVEAARSGKHGLGFAVVAGEVRRLALHSAEASKQTEELVASSLRAIDNGRIVTQEAQEVFKNIQKITNQTTTISSEISSLSANQTSGVVGTENHIRNTEKISSTNLKIAQDVKTASQNLENSINSLEKLIAYIQI